MATTRFLFQHGQKQIPAQFLCRRSSAVRNAFQERSLYPALCLVVPWFGRAALGWIVDMSAIGTALAYLFTNLTAYKYLSQNPSVPESGWGKPVCVIGAMTSVICFCLPIFPASPAAISVPSWIMLYAWVALGGFFFMQRKSELLHISHSRLRYLLWRQLLPGSVLMTKNRTTRKPLNNLAAYAPGKGLGHASPVIARSGADCSGH